MTIGLMRIAYLIPKTTKTHSEYIILLLFPGNLGCTNPPRYTYIGYLVMVDNLSLIP
jgi:hypothetical protein